MLQVDKDKLNKWSEDWLLNSTSTSARKRTRRRLSDWSWSEQEKLHTVVEEKDLEVYITNDLKWSEQCSALASKSRKAL